MHAFFAALAVLALSSSARAQITQLTGDPLSDELAIPGGLRVADVIQAALGTSHELRARQHELEAARAEVDRAWLGLIPRLALSAGYTRLSEIDPPTLGYVAAPADQSRGGPIAPGTPLVAIPISFPAIVDQIQLRAQLAIPLTDYFTRVLPRRDAAEHAAAAAAATLDSTRARAALDAEAVYWGWARAKLATVVARHALAQAEAHALDARRVLDAGLGIEADVARADAQVAATRELALSTEHLRDAIADHLRTIMHVDAIPDAIGELLPESAPALPALEPALRHALRRRSELRALDAQIAALEAQRAIVDAGLAPRIDLVGEVLVGSPNPRFVPQQERFDTTWAVGARASWELADAAAAVPARRSLDARIEAVRSSRELSTEAIRAELVDARRMLADAASAIETRGTQLVAAERTLALASERFRVGRGTGLAVIDAQLLAVRARLDLLQGRIDAAVASARWRRALEE